MRHSEASTSFFSEEEAQLEGSNFNHPVSQKGSFLIFSFWSYFLLLIPGNLYIIDRLGERNLNILQFILYKMSFKSYARTL